MKLGYNFIHLGKIQEVFNEAEQAGKTLTPIQAMGTMKAGMPLILEQARNAMLEVELTGPEEPTRDLMENIEKHLASKGWTKTEAEVDG